MNNTRKNQGGVAIIFTLGILSVLLLLALAFASSSRINRKIAENVSNTATARILAESTLNRVTNLLQVYSDDSGYLYAKPYSNAISTTSYTSEPANNIHTTDNIKNISTSETGDVSSVAPYNHATNGISWQFIYQYNDPNGDSDSNPFTDNGGSRDSTKIIGRIAYVILNGNSVGVIGAGIDPGDLVKSGVDETAYAEERKGIDINEINLRSIDSNTITNAYANLFNYTGTGGGVYSGSWQSFSNLYNYLGIPTTATATRNDFMKWFVIDATKEPEAFWLERVSVNNKVDTDALDPTNPIKNELYHRFNLARTDWGTISLSKIIPNTITAGSWPVANDVFNVVYPVGTTDGNGIPWIDKWESTGTFATAAARGKQIAANLKDYCDSDSDVTSDSADWSTSAPSYTGNEKTPYLNEITVYVESSLAVSGGPIPGTDYTCSATFKCYLGAEIVNLYGQSGNAKVRLSGEWKYDRVAPNGTTYSSTKAFTNFDIDIAFSAGELYKSATEAESVGFGPFSTGSPDNNTMPSVSDINLRITKAYLITDVSGSDKNADYCKVDPAWQQINAVIPPTGTDTTAYAFFTFEVDDPRQNLNQSDWTLTKVISAASTGGGTLDAKNSNCNPNPGGAKDTESSTAMDASPLALSTAFIRNAPMQSPWELGAIHRGAKWETINLKEYDNVANVLPQGGNLYRDPTNIATLTNHGGDANILDQIKMTSNVTSPKKISLKYQGDDTSGATPKGLLTALFRKLGLRSAYLAPGAVPTHEPDDLFIKPIVVNIKAGSATMKSRAAISNISGIWDDSQVQLKETGPSNLDRDNDARREEIIGKIVNLTSASTSVSSTEYFTIVILAQTIKDVGTPLSTIGTTISKNVSGVGLTTVNYCKLGQYDQYADEITGEQKIKAVIYREPSTKKCTIVSMEYLEE